jgi:RNA polymerase sigma-70 factor (ECF subfamily)
MEADELALVAAARAGDAAAFERLIARHADAVFRVCAGHLGAQDAEDAAQEVFLRIHQGLAGFEGSSQLSTWIFRVATNVSLTRSKQKRRRKSVAPLEAAPEPVARGTPDGLEHLESEERREAVRRAVRELPEEQRAVAVLRALEGYSFEEVAQILGIKRPTAESRMNRAKERLKNALTRWLKTDAPE